MIATTKYCSGCEMEHPIEEFGKRKNSPDGLDKQCKKYLATRKRIRNKLKKQYDEIPTIELNKQLNKELTNEKICVICGEFWELNNFKGDICGNCLKVNTKKANFKEINNNKLNKLYSYIITKDNLANVIIRCVHDKTIEQYELRIFIRNKGVENELFWYKDVGINNVIEKAGKEIMNIEYDPETWTEEDGFAMWQDYKLK